MEETSAALTNGEPGKKTESSKALHVLIVGDSQTLEESQELLNSLKLIGYDIAVLGAVTWSGGAAEHQKHPGAKSYVLEDLKKRLKATPPDIVILTTDDEELRNAIMDLMRPETRFLDPFVLKIIKGLKDVSLQLASARTRLQSVELMKEVLMSGPETSIMVVDEDFKIVEISNAILERTKKSREDCIGQQCHWIIRKTMESCYMRGEQCVVKEVIQKGKAVHTVREERRTDNSARYFTISSYPLPRDEHGKKNVMIVWKDVSKQMTPVLNRQAQSIRDSFAQTLQQDKMTALGKLASAAVHEINNPIQGIFAFAKLMRLSFEKKSLTYEEMERFRTYLDLISVESERCGKILHGLLSFSRKGDLKKSGVDLTKIFEDVALLMENRMKIQGIILCLEKPKIMPVIYGDGDQIKQALLNIILNSVEAMPNGGLITLSSELHPDEKRLTIRIQDTGEGIPKSVQSNIFEPFFTTKDDGKGTGLGLSVVFGIMSQHGGTIEVESSEGEGTIFEITLPIAAESLD
jgi:two-component system, NtrC family, sensor kinase